MYNESLAERVRNELASTPFTEVKMFGGLCFLVGGNMACGIYRDDLMVRTGRAQHADALAAPHVKPMEFTGRPMGTIVLVEPAGLDDESLARWVRLGATFAADLPPKAMREPRSKRTPKARA
jgi:hypothetical protein